METEKYKIVYLLPGGLFNPGGMERVTIHKANYLTENKGYDISIVTTEQMGRPVFFPVSEKVHLYHLDIGIYTNFGKESYAEKVVSRFLKTRQYKKALSRLLNEIRPDITISTLGGLDIEFLNDLKDGSIKLGELHFPGNFRELMGRQLSDRFIPNFVARLRTHSFKRKCGKLSRLIVLTEEEKSFWQNKSNVEVIPNLLPFYPDQVSSCIHKRAIAVGRLSYEKGFDLLIESWKVVAEKYPDWELHIFGQGIQKEKLLQLIANNKLELAVKIHEPVADVYSQYFESSILVFPSRYLDAFGMVIAEVMSCGVPPVAFNSPCGPKDIITEGKDGFLVETGDTEGMAKRICDLIESDDLRLSMSKAARESSLRYREDQIMERWIQLFKMLRK